MLLISQQLQDESGTWRVVEVILTRWTTVVGAVLLLVFMAGAQAGQGEKGDSCRSVIDRAMNDVSHLKPGLTRADVERMFYPDGGIQSFHGPTRYIYRPCHSIKIDVEFAPARADEGLQGSAEDGVKSVSKPYLENPFFD
jgi:hypothetical protein